MNPSRVFSYQLSNRTIKKVDGPRRECTYGPNGLCRLSRGLSNYDCNISKCVFPVKGHGAIKAQCRPTTNRQYNRAPLHGLPAERHRQGIPGNLQPLRQHQGSKKMAQIAGFYPIFLIFSASNRLRTRIK